MMERIHERYSRLMMCHAGVWQVALLLLFCVPMNFLGHLYLSGTDPLVTVGNFMADAVKGRDLGRFPLEVQKGIRLHRAIDSYTDQHPMVLKGKERARPSSGRYAAVVVDIFYDHLFALQWSQRHQLPLQDFTRHTYALLTEHIDLLPDRTRQMLPYMISGDWLGSYATIDGIARALTGLSKRVNNGAAMSGAEAILAGNLEAYAAEFNTFLPQVIEHVEQFK